MHSDSSTVSGRSCISSLPISNPRSPKPKPGFAVRTHTHKSSFRQLNTCIKSARRPRWRNDRKQDAIDRLLSIALPRSSGTSCRSLSVFHDNGQLRNFVEANDDASTRPCAGLPDRPLPVSVIKMVSGVMQYLKSACIAGLCSRLESRRISRDDGMEKTNTT
jgi:hypothetical protein